MVLLILIFLMFACGVCLTSLLVAKRRRAQGDVLYLPVDEVAEGDDDDEPPPGEREPRPEIVDQRPDESLAVPFSNKIF